MPSCCLLSHFFYIWDKGKVSGSISSPPRLLLIHFPLAPLTLTHILSTFTDPTQQQPPISPTRAVIGHSRCVALCVCVWVWIAEYVLICISTDRMCVCFKHLSSVAPKVSGRCMGWGQGVGEEVCVYLQWWVCLLYVWMQVDGEPGGLWRRCWGSDGKGRAEMKHKYTTCTSVLWILCTNIHCIYLSMKSTTAVKKSDCHNHGGRHCKIHSITPKTNNWLNLTYVRAKVQSPKSQQQIHFCCIPPVGLCNLNRHPLSKLYHVLQKPLTQEKYVWGNDG